MKTVNMDLTLPTVGPQGTQGPDWALELDQALSQIDYHNHIPGRGTTLSNNSFNVDSDFDLNHFNFTEVEKIGLVSLATQLTSINLIYDLSGEFYYNDKNGNKIQLTSLGNINVPSINGITGDYATSDADLSYSDVSKSYIFKQTALITANTEHGPLKIYKPTLGSVYAQIKQDDTQSVDLDFTWPEALPLTSQVIRSTNAGVLNPNEIQSTDLTNASIINSKMATDSVDTINFVNSSINPSKRSIANYTISSSTGILSLGLNAKQFVSELNITITTTGRPLCIGLKPSGSSESSILLGASNVFVGLVVDLYRNGDFIVRLTPSHGSFDVTQSNFPPRLINFFDPVSAGIYSYTFYFSVGSITSLTLKNIQSYAYEL